MRRLSGQVGTEYLLVIAVVVIAVSAAAYGLVPPFRSGVERVGADVRHILGTGRVERPATSPASPRGPANAGCSAGVVCNPETPRPLLGAPPRVCTDRC